MLIIQGNILKKIIEIVTNILNENYEKKISNIELY